MDEKSLAHTKRGCVYHVVWMPKYRRKALYKECRAEVGSVMRELVEKKTGCEVVEGSACSDRVRVCPRIPPKHAVPDAMGCLKGKSALVLCDRHPEWRSRVGKDRTFWARGCCVGTVRLNESAVGKCIADQEEGSRFGR